MEALLSTLLDTLRAGISKFHSRKFIVWVVATVALFSKFITNDQWVMITMTWSGIEGVLDFHGLPATAKDVLNGKSNKKSDDESAG